MVAMAKKGIGALVRACVIALESPDFLLFSSSTDPILILSYSITSIACNHSATSVLICTL